MALADAIALFRRWVWILRKDGLTPFIKQGFLFLIRCLFSYQTFYLYREILDNKLDEVESTPKIHNFALKIISANEQTDELMASGFDFGSFVISADRRLDRGAIAFCALVERKLTHICWVAMTEQAKDSITDIPYPVDFSNNEAYLGRTVKNLKYWRMGNFSVTIVYLKAMQFLWRSGKTVCRFVVSKNNLITQNVLAKRIGARPCGEGRYLKLLWWKFWKEKPIQAAKITSRHLT